MGPSFLSPESRRRRGGGEGERLAGGSYKVSLGQGSTKHLHPRAVKGHSVHYTEEKGGRMASNASEEL